MRDTHIATQNIGNNIHAASLEIDRLRAELATKTAECERLLEVMEQRSEDGLGLLHDMQTQRDVAQAECERLAKIRAELIETFAPMKDERDLGLAACERLNGQLAMVSLDLDAARDLANELGAFFVWYVKQHDAKNDPDKWTTIQKWRAQPWAKGGGDG